MSCRFTFVVKQSIIDLNCIKDVSNFSLQHSPIDVSYRCFHIFELVARSIHAMARYVEYIPVEAIRHTKDIIATEPYSKGAFNEFLRFVLITMNFPSSKKKLYV